MAQMQTVAGSIAAWIFADHAAGRFAASARGRALARDAIVDTLACAWAGRGDDTVARVAQVAAATPGPAALFGGGRTEAGLAAMINGTAAHALDFDDNFAPGMSHASAVILPALLAAAPESATGRDLIDAWLVALQAQAFVGQGVGPGHYTAGWHGTSTIGPIGTAAGVAWLMGGDQEAVRRALTLACSFASGTKGQFGTPAKPFHAGLAARNAVEAARLAMAGLEGHILAFEGPQGFAEMFRGPSSPGYDCAAIRATSVHVAETVGVVPKLHPCCGSTHFVIDALADLRRSHRIDAEDVVAIETHIGIANLRNLPYIHPKNEMEARFSMTWCMARALRTGRLTLQDFTPEALRAHGGDPLITRLKMTSWTPEEEAAALPDRLPHRLRLTLSDGRVLEAGRMAPTGALSDPFDPALMAQKFLDCCTDLPGAAQLHERLQELDAWPDLTPFAALFAPPPVPH